MTSSTTILKAIRSTKTIVVICIEQQNEVQGRERTWPPRLQRPQRFDNHGSVNGANSANLIALQQGAEEMAVHSRIGIRGLQYRARAA